MSFAVETNLSKYLNPIFFECGTFLGEGTKSALRCGFNKVITIELQEYLYNQCVNGDENGGQDLVKEITEGKVEIYLGDSRNLMWRLIEPINDRITFWLDSHIDGGNVRPGVTPDIPPCPLYEEIRTISKHHIKNHTILIDDLRIIGSEYTSGYGWGYGINIDEIKEMILQINPKYEFSYENGYQENDILVAYVP